MYIAGVPIEAYIIGAILSVNTHSRILHLSVSTVSAVDLHVRCLHLSALGLQRPPGSSALCTIVVSTILCYSVGGYRSTL